MRSTSSVRPAVVAPEVTEVLIFSTSVTHPAQITPLRRGLAAFGHWNFDLDDCDHILRVETDTGDGPRIIALLAAHGLYCAELPD